MTQFNQYIHSQIFKLLDYIEHITGSMAHEILLLKEPLEKWNNGELNDIYFREYLNKFIDNL